MEARRGISCGHLVLTARTEKVTKGVKDNWSETRRIWFLGDRIRVDTSTDPPRDGVPSSTECINYDGRGTHLVHVDTRTAVQIGKSRVLPGGIIVDRAFDPRLIGYVPTLLSTLGQPHTNRLDGHVGAIPFGPEVRVKTERTTLDGKDVWAVRYTGPGLDPESSVWLSPAEGHNPVKITCSAAEAGERWSFTLTNVLRLFPNNTWFVDSYKFERADPNGDRAVEHAKVVEATFNDPAAVAGAFTFEGMGIRPGHLVYDVDTRKAVVYDGVKLNPDVQHLAASARSRPAEPAEPIPGGVNPWMVAVCVGSAALAVALFVRFLSTRRPSPA